MAERERSIAKGVLICANPFSGSGPNRKLVDDLVTELERRGFEPKLVWDIDERQACLSDVNLSDWCRCVLVAGGDGSIGAVLNELYQARRKDGDVQGQVVALATLPMGNENLFAKYFGFTQSAKQLVDAIEAGQTKRIDLGLMSTEGSRSGGWVFTLMGGVGFDADVVHRMHRWRETHSGLRRVKRVTYVPRVLSSLWRYRYPKLKVEVDGETYTGSHLFVFNLPSYGGGLKLAPGCCVEDDGKLDWVLFERPGLISLARYAVSVAIGRHLKRKDVKCGQSADIRVTWPRGMAVQLDGDPAGLSPVSFSVVEIPGLELLIT